MLDTLLLKSGLPLWFLLVAVVLLSTLLMFLLKRLALGRLEKILQLQEMTFLSVLSHALKMPVGIVVLIVNLFLLEYLFSYFAISDEHVSSYYRSAAQILTIVALIVFVDRFVLGLVEAYAAKSTVMRDSKIIVGGVVRGIVVIIGLLVLLGTLGISITPVVASLGITSLAVALALQPTLENFFSGIQLLVDKPIRVGDFIELDSGEQGFVEKIGWRSTWIRMLPNNTVIMPNCKLSQSKIINYFYPEKQLSVPVEVGVHYSSDLEKVEKITLEVARQVLKDHEWGVSDYNTFVIFHTFDSSSINFTVMLRVQEYFHRFFVKSAFIKALHTRYAQEGIVIPYPIRAINTSQERPEMVVTENSL